MHPVSLARWRTRRILRKPTHATSRDGPFGEAASRILQNPDKMVQEDLQRFKDIAEGRVQVYGADATLHALSGSLGPGLLVLGSRAPPPNSELGTPHCRSNRARRACP